VDPGTVDWSQYLDNDKPIPYYFMQVPSRHNALGKIKFMFPNSFSVYIHDTPSKKLFFRRQRAFSHGCMRIQKPRELLESLAEFNGNIDVDEVMKRLAGTEKKTISLHHPVPIDIVYLTTFIDPYGNLNFRKDIYQYDALQMKPYRANDTAKKLRPSKSKEIVIVDREHIKKHLSESNHSLVVTPLKGSKPLQVKKKVTHEGYNVIEIY
jgi:murein L,D-transpeptidase YcbB/YkuD